MTAARPRIRPFLLNAVDTGCPRWLAAELDPTRPRDATSFHRGDLRGRLLDELQAAHRELRAATPGDFRTPVGMQPEQKWLHDHFAAVYCELFAARPGRHVDHGCDSATPFGKRGIDAAGWVDLLLELPDGTHELRQLELWDGALAADPWLSWETALAALRIRKNVDAVTTLRVTHVDLNAGATAEATVDLATDAVDLAKHLDEQLARLRARTTVADPVPGSSCTRCAHVRACTAFDGRAPTRITTPYTDGLVGETIALGPSRLATWLACPRQFRNRHLLDLPAVDRGGDGPNEGNLVHQLLRVLHQDGPCGPAPSTRIDQLVDDHDVPNPDRIRSMLEAHARRCPTGAESWGHERELAQLRTERGLTVMVAGRVDAAWIHDGWLDARDYKTGARAVDRVQDDAAARVTAWLLAPVADALDLRLRLAFEHLRVDTDDDPEPFVPGDDDMAAIEAELDEAAAGIASEDFTATPHATVCGHCSWRSACPESAAGPAGSIADHGRTGGTGR